MSAFSSFAEIRMEKTKQQMEDEFQEIDFGQESASSNSTFVCKKVPPLDRFPGILPFKSNRVVLDQDECDNHYINASYIRVSCSFRLVSC
jgi:protein tyrosine phosphatase